MKRTLVLLFVLAALAGFYFGTKDKGEAKTSIKVEDREFLLQDTDEVAVITIEAKNKPGIHLGKMDGQWYINNKHKANPRIVDNMLFALSKMIIMYIPTKAENETAKNRMEQHGIDIKTYDKAGKLITDFTMGTNTNSEYGTYCLKRDAHQTYVMARPVVQGGIRDYFKHTLEDLKDLTVFSYHTNDIRKIAVTYPKDMANSYEIIRNGLDLEYSVNGKATAANANTLDAYVKDFKSMTSEFIKNDHTMKDDITSKLPFMKLEIIAQNKPDFSIDVYPSNDIEYEDTFTRSPKDITPQHEKFFIYTNQGDFYRVQDRFIKKFIKTAGYFKSN